MARVSSDNYGVIGVGYFGSAVARTLATSGKSVIAIDIDQSKLRDLSAEVSSVYQIDDLSKEALEDAGIGNCATVVIGIGENLEASLPIALSSAEEGRLRRWPRVHPASDFEIMESSSA